MFPLSHMMSRFVQKGQLDIIDHNGKRHTFTQGVEGPRVVMRLSDPSLYRKLVYSTELAAGEAYMDGRLTMEEGTDLRDFFRLYKENRNSVGRQPAQKVAHGINMMLRRWHQSNRKGEAQQNVQHHYDLGNDFYRLFLDDNMLYSCAYFRNDNESLEQAQRNKLRLLASKMVLKPGQRVLDIGSGWGDMALYLASMEDVHVTGVTLSEEQHALSTERAARMGLSDRVEFRLQDYRDLNDRFDRIVSVGMFEHVGVQNYDEYFQQMNRLMPDDGIAVLHSIGHMSPPSTASTWLRKYIFPGGYSPALSEVFPSLERNNLWCMDMEVLRLHYAETLKHWDRRFQENREKVIEMYDEKFARMWEFYLVSCEAMFRTGAQMVFQVQLSRNRDAAPLQRDYMIDTQRAYEKKEAQLKLAS